MDDKVEYKLSHFCLSFLIGMLLVVLEGVYMFSLSMYFETYFHEMSHALTTLFLNGNVNEIVINPSGSGHCLSSHNVVETFGLISISGYMGASIFGCLLFFSERIFGNKKYHFKSALLAMIAVSFFYMKVELPTLLITSFVFISFTYMFFQKHEIVETVFLKTIGIIIMVGACISPSFLFDIPGGGGDALLVQEFFSFSYNGIIYFWTFFSMFVFTLSLTIEYLIITKKEGTYATR